MSGTDVAAYWDRNADQWTRDVRAGHDVYRDLFTFPAFADFLPPLEGRDVIDFGCGEGTNTRRFADMGAHMTGIDISARLIAHAEAAERQVPLGIGYRRASYSDPCGFPEQSFDGVVSTLALMDGPDFAGAMKEAFRLVKPGGFIAFSVLHPCFVTPGLHWEKDENGNWTALCVSRYFDRSDFVEEWRFSNRGSGDVAAFSVPRFPRTLGDYLNAVIAAGFRISKIDEPCPSEEAIRKVPRFARWRDLGAFLLLVAAEKPVA